MRTNERIAKFVTMFADDASYATLIDNMAAENWDEAFRAAHTLKGTARDMGFIDLSDRRKRSYRGIGAPAMLYRPKSSYLL